MTYRTVARFDGYSIIEPCNRKIYERELQQKRRKADRETTVTTYIVGFLVIAASILMNL